eukprot:scaffold12856_cov47-Phaeocystis_antarctica.AAC.1
MVRGSTRSAAPAAAGPSCATPPPPPPPPPRAPRRGGAPAPPGYIGLQPLSYRARVRGEIGVKVRSGVKVRC